MPFPDKKRIIYNKNPLDQVICQLRFPPILKIDTEIPVEFQEKIRKDFPRYMDMIEGQIEFSPKVKFGKSSEVSDQMLTLPGYKNHEFISEDDLWKINLTRNFVALSTKNYTRWEDFKGTFKLILDAFSEVYSPTFFTRAGLRYIDLFKRSKLGLNDEAWQELLNPHILGLLGSSDISSNVIDFESKYEIGLNDKSSMVRLVSKYVKDKNDNEICYMIDCDFFNTARIKSDEVFKLLDYFNVRGSRLIQWLITDKLHNAMGPKEL